MGVFIIALSLFLGEFGDVQIVKNFESSSPYDEELSYPYSMVFSPDGKLFALDRGQSRIFVWSAEGQFVKAFGQQGEGPGELFFPVKIAADKQQVAVWSANRQISLFSHNGDFQKSFKVLHAEPRNLALLKGGDLLIGYRNLSDPENSLFSFEIVDQNGEKKQAIKDFPNNFFLSRTDSETPTIKAFGPEGDIQRDEKGRLYFGFSESKTIYRMGADNQLKAFQFKDLPNVKPTDTEIEMVKNISFASPMGGRVALNQLPLKLSFDHDKANYTHFLVSGDKVAFVLTPLGSLGAVNGWHEATFYICDLKTQKTLSRGSYRFPEDSVALFRNSRSLVFLINAEGEYEIQEFRLKGL